MSMYPAKQPFHILKKDVIHLWPETLVSLALLVAFCWADVQTWQPVQGEGFNPTVLAAGILKLLLPISWLVLTSRLVHDEELVGDRQFWTTRPYTWYSLLASKVLYLVLFVCIPFVAMQVWLLHHAGLYPTHLVRPILMNLLPVSIIFLLPLLVLAAVTATFVRYASSVLGGFIYVFAILAVTFYNWPNNLDVPYYDRILSAVFLLFPLAALLVQYSRRRTMVARLILVAMPIVFLILFALAPANMLTQRRYPNTAVGSLAFDNDPAQQEPAGRLVTFQHRNMIELPVQVDFKGLPSDDWIEIQRVQANIEGQGVHYHGDWTPVRSSLYPGKTQHTVAFQLPEKIYQQIHGKSVAVHLTLGVQVFKPGTPYNVKATETAFPIPEHGSCTVSVDDGALSCRFPFSNPSFARVQATVHNGNCLVPGPATAMAFGALTPTSSPLNFTPVEISKTPLAVGQTNVSLCPGTPITIIPVVGDKYARMTLDVPALTLDPYARRIPVKEAGDESTPTKP